MSTSTPKKSKTFSHYADDMTSYDAGYQQRATTTTPTRHWWSIDKEMELCRIWEEEINLYDMAHHDHRNAQARSASLRRMSLLLKTPGKLENMLNTPIFL
jgi:hypothetical protein